MHDDLSNRIARIYAALGVMIEADIQRATRISRSDNHIGVRFDGGMTYAELENYANTAIALVAHLPDHLKKWLRSKSLPTTEIDNLYKHSPPIQLLADLANTEKHGGFDRNGGWSKKQPVLANLVRGLNLDPQDGGAPANIRFDASTGAITTQAGSPRVVIDAEVTGSDGRVLCRLTTLLSTGLEELEAIYGRHSGQVV